MSNINYAKDIFDSYHSRFISFGDGNYDGCFLELGPGGSLFSGIFALAIGFKRAILIDISAFATNEYMVYDNLIAKYLPQKLESFRTEYKIKNNIFNSLKIIGIDYYTDGLDSLSLIKSDSISFSFSNAVLEHVRLNEIQKTINELYRIHTPNSLSIHKIDFKDHLGGGLNNLRIPKKIWENTYFPNSGFYTNRLRHNNMLKIFNVSGFSILSTEIEKWNNLPIVQEKISNDFIGYSYDNLLIKNSLIVAHKLKH